MRIRPFASADELRHVFEPFPAEYFGFTPLLDCKVGFSVRRDYPPGLAYYPPKTADGRDDTSAIFHIIYTHPSDSEQPIDLRRVPLTAKVSTWSAYAERRHRYDPDDPDCPTPASLERSRRSRKPIWIRSEGDYFIDHEASGLVDAEGRKVSPETALEHLFALHCKTTRLFRGLRLRMLLRGSDLATSGLTLLIKALLRVLRGCLGRELQVDSPVDAYFRGYRSSQMRVRQNRKISLYGYEASWNVVMTFACLALGSYTLAYLAGVQSAWLDGIIRNPVLTLLTVVSLLGLLDFGGPRVVIGLATWMTRLRSRLYLTRFRL